jgi:hypothetical protein
MYVCTHVWWNGKVLHEHAGSKVYSAADKNYLIMHDNNYHACMQFPLKLIILLSESLVCLFIKELYFYIDIVVRVSYKFPYAQNTCRKF